MLHFLPKREQPKEEEKNNAERNFLPDTIVFEIRTTAQCGIYNIEIFYIIGIIKR